MKKGEFLYSTDSLINIEVWGSTFLSIVAVNCYILISGYFMSSKSFKLSRITGIYSQMWFYSVTTYILLVVINGVDFSKGQLLRSLFPFVFGNYWFVVNYIILLFMSPLLNSALRNISESKFRLILFSIVLIFCIYNTIMLPINPIDDTRGFGFFWFIVLYITASYIRRFYIPNGKWAKYLILYILIAIFGLVMHYILRPLGDLFSVEMLENYNSISVYMQSICLFLMFLNIKITNTKLCKYILKIAPLTFAVYLIHESLGFKVYLWELININTLIIPNYIFIFMAFIIVLLIFTICCFVEVIRKWLFKALKIDRFIIKMSNYVEIKIRYIVCRK